jgi:hypothetical protein
MKPRPDGRPRTRRQTRALLRVLALVSAGVFGLVMACGNGGDEPLLDLDPPTPDGSATTTTTSTATGTSRSGDAGASDTGAACPTVDQLLVSYGLAATCAPCIDTACATALAQCNTSCTCPDAIVGFVECVSLGANESTCAGVASTQTTPTLVLDFFMCGSSCESQCHLADPDAGSDAGGSDAGDAGDAAAAVDSGDAGAPDAADAGHDGG